MPSDPTDRLREALYVLAVLCDLAGFELRMVRLGALEILPYGGASGPAVEVSIEPPFTAFELSGGRVCVPHSMRDRVRRVVASSPGSPNNWRSRPLHGRRNASLEHAIALEVAEAKLDNFRAAVLECVGAWESMRPLRDLADGLADSRDWPGSSK